MERMGLVSRVEAQLERMISLGQLPADGSLPSEQMLARRYDVSRATLREALLRLAVRGLVVQRPGRRTRAVALDEAVTLENLGVALHGEDSSHPERRRLLEGYLALKREIAVELLAACCEHASSSDLELLKEACFALGEAARWEEEGRGWVKREFELLRLAARAADRPGHFLLIQSLERSFWGMAARVLPHLDPEAIQQWVQCAFHALGERDAQMLRRELLPLLHVSDEHVLGRPAPTFAASDTPRAHRFEARPLRDEGTEPHHTEAAPRQQEKAEAHRTETAPLLQEDARAHRNEAEPIQEENAGAEPMMRGLPEPTFPNLSGCLISSCQSPSAGGPQAEAASTGSLHPPGWEAGRGPTSHPPAACSNGRSCADTLPEPLGPLTCEARGCPEGQPCIPGAECVERCCRCGARV